MNEIFGFISTDNEAWFPGFVQDAVDQCMKKPTVQFLDNICSLVELQANFETSLPDSMTCVTKFADCLHRCHLSLIHLAAADKQALPNVLKLFHYVPLPRPLGVSQMHEVCRLLPRQVFVILEDRTTFPNEERVQHIAQIVTILSDVIAGNHIACLTIAMRTLISMSLKSKYSGLFGSRTSAPAPSKPVSLFKENLKFGAMPAHPLGVSTVFHAGVIGDGARRPPDNKNPPDDVVKENTLTFVSFIFKLCHNFAANGNGAKKATSPREKDLMRERSKEACKQMALLLVDIVSPDVMYNGLPWPEEEFTKVTKERDLLISKKFEENPILWKLLAGLAEARPALCYCSVLLRALLAVQMSYWQTSVAPKASNSPKQLEVTVHVLRLLSVGQFIPHPLDSVADVIHVMHPFHVLSILFDIWNYVRDNVPSPVTFAASLSPDAAMCREFEPYKNYRTYCEKLRLIMIRHIAEVPNEFKKFFVDFSDRHEQAMKIAMEY